MCSWHKRSKVEYQILNNIAVISRGEEPHIAARRLCLRILTSIVAASARRTPHSARRPPPTACHPLHGARRGWGRRRRIALFCDKLTKLGWLTLSVLKYLMKIKKIIRESA
jgi:hypothetical protein